MVKKLIPEKKEKQNSKNESNKLEKDSDKIYECVECGIKIANYKILPDRKKKSKYETYNIRISCLQCYNEHENDGTDETYDKSESDISEDYLSDNSMIWLLIDAYINYNNSIKYTN